MIKFTDVYSDPSNQYLIDMIKLIDFRKQNPLTYIKLRKNRPQNYIECQRHHIIPRCIYKDQHQPIDNSNENLICF